MWVAQTCNPSYSGDQEHHRSSKPTQAEFSRSYLKKIHDKKGLAEWLKQ
jgi:hypothetical protein